ncbi:hypothetical protein GW17_00022443 [Ensete ventricosum]|nr:hypothetical protein GW17_00022443 [Ensete ventricosum]
MVDGVEDYTHQIAEMIGLRNESNFIEAGVSAILLTVRELIIHLSGWATLLLLDINGRVRTVLDIGCGFGSFGAHLFSKQLLTMCIATYEVSAGVHPEDFAEDAARWSSAIHSYWSLLSPLIFSDHPKRPGDEDPSPPFNMIRNVLDMNAHFGGFNAALLDAGKSVWVMNVVPANGPNYLPLIFDRGFIGVQHDWYTIVLYLMQGWVVIRDTAYLVETARTVITQLRWDARLMELDSSSNEKLLVCQKPFFRKQQ